MRHHRVVPFVVFALLAAGCAQNAGKPRESVNSLGMTLVHIAPESFDMGVDSVPLPPELTKGVSGASWDRPDGNGDYDEVPVHRGRRTRLHVDLQLSAIAFWIPAIVSAVRPIGERFRRRLPRSLRPDAVSAIPSSRRKILTG